MMTVIKSEFIKLMKGYLKYYIGSELNLKVQEKNNSIIGRFTVYGHVFEVTLKELGNRQIELTSMFRFQHGTQSILGNHRGLCYKYRYKTEQGNLYFGIQGTLYRSDMKIVLDKLFADFIAIVRFIKTGVEPENKYSYLDSCITEKEAWRKVMTIQRKYSDVINNMYHYFSSINEEEFKKYYHGTRFCFDQEGEFIGTNMVVPPRAYEIMKKGIMDTPDDMVNCVLSLYGDIKEELENDLEDFCIENDLKHQFSDTFSDLDFEEAQDFCERHGVDEYLKDEEPRSMRYLLLDTLVQPSLLYPYK